MSKKWVSPSWQALQDAVYRKMGPGWSVYRKMEANRYNYTLCFLGVRFCSIGDTLNDAWCRIIHMIPDTIKWFEGSMMRLPA